MNIFTQFFKKNAGNREAQVQEITTELIRREAKIGGELFGPVPNGVTREFFCLNDSTWVWFEKWQENGEMHTKTTRYVVRESGVFKSVNDSAYQSVGIDEAKNLDKAIKMYLERVGTEMYAQKTA